MFVKWRMPDWGRIVRRPRSEVRGGGRKPWRQKGTGRARQGSIRSAQWVGGGKIHTPKPQRLQQENAASRCAEQLYVLHFLPKLLLMSWLCWMNLNVKEPKTRLMVQALKKLVGDSSALILVPEKNDAYNDVELSARNLPDAKTLMVNYLNIRDLLGYERIVLPVQALEKISAHLG